MKRHYHLGFLGGLLLLVHISFVCGDEAFPCDENPCRTIRGPNGEIIRTVPKTMHSFPFQVQGIRQHFVCVPGPDAVSNTTTTPTADPTTTTDPMTTTDPTTIDPSTTTYHTTTTNPTTSTNPTTITDPTTIDPSTTAYHTTTTNLSTITNPTTITDLLTTKDSTTTKDPTTLTDHESNACNSNPCHNGGSCNATQGRFDCVCLIGFQGSTCEIAVSISFVASCGQVFAASLSPEDSPLSATYSLLSLEGLQTPYSLDYDPLERVLYWTDFKSESISRASLDGSWQETVVNHSTGLHTGELALDIHGRNVYWAKYSGDSIEKVNFNGSNREVAVGHRYLPRGLAIDGVNRVLYWKERQYVMRSDLDGSNITEIAQSPGSESSCIFYDTTASLLFFTDSSTHAVYSVLPNGTDLVQVVRLNETNFSHITLYKNILAWSNWEGSVHGVGELSLLNVSSFYIRDNPPGVTGTCLYFKNIHVYSVE